MALPNWGGNTRYVGPTGATGPAGTPGTSGGQTLYLDSATSTTVPTLGSLLIAPNLGAQTTISYAASSSTVLIAKFPTEVGALASTFITPGLWDLSIYAKTSSTTNTPQFYWSLYQVDADGVSNPVLIVDGSADPISVTNTAETLYVASLYVPAYTLTNSTKRLSVYVYGVYVGGNRRLTFAFRLGTVSHVHTTLGAVPYNWSSYPATQDVDIAAHNITNVNTLTASVINTATTTTTYLNSTVTNANTVNAGVVATTNVSNGSSSNALTLQSPSNDTNLKGNRVFVAASQDAVVSAYSDVTITASNGNRGRINLTSSQGYLNGLAGEVNITANGGTVGVYPLDYATGGLVNITANTPAASYYTTTSAIKLSAASVLSYAGAVTPVGSLLGYNYIQGTLGVNIVAGTASSVPNVPGTNYLYGVNGTTIQNTLYTDTIRNISTYPLNLISTSNNISLTASNTGNNITLTSSNINLNGTVGLTGNLNMSNNNIINVPSISASSNLALTATSNISLNAGAFNSITLSANNTINTGNFNMCNKILFNVGEIDMQSAGLINMFGGTISNLGNILGSNLTISTGGNLNLTSSTGGNVSLYTTTGNAIVSNASNSFVQSTGTEISSLNYMVMYGPSVNISNTAGTNKLDLGYGTAGAQLISSNYCRMRNLSNNFLLDDDAKLAASGTITLSNGNSSIVMPPLSSIVATGGDINYTPTRKTHTFTSNGVFEIVSGAGVTIEIMAIGGGGGGGVQAGGGGGAGNMIIARGVLTAGTYVVSIGPGGAGGEIAVSGGHDGGTTTVGSILSALGGGGGGTYSIESGRNGGCGGGGSELDWRFMGSAVTGSVSSPLTAISNLAQNGGEGFNRGSCGGAGGGGTRRPGASQGSAASAGRNGGAGTIYNGKYYGGGGGGSQGGIYFGPPYDGGVGGLGGGGTGSTIGSGTSLVRGTAGTPNTGGGGGGATGYSPGDTLGLDGGSGIVIISYDYSGGDVDITAQGTIYLTAPLTVVSNDLVVAGTTTLPTLNASSISNTTFNGYVSSVIQNPGYLQLYEDTFTGFDGTRTYQIYGQAGWDGSAIKVGDLPAGVYIINALCTNNTLRSLNATLSTPGAGVLSATTPAGNPAVAILANTTNLDFANYVYVKARTVTSGGITNMYIDFNNTTSGSGDNFIFSIVMISGQWDGTMSWVYP